jgi:hypothetical protein
MSRHIAISDARPGFCIPSRYRFSMTQEQNQGSFWVTSFTRETNFASKSLPLDRNLDIYSNLCQRGLVYESQITSNPGFGLGVREGTLVACVCAERTDKYLVIVLIWEGPCKAQRGGCFKDHNEASPLMLTLHVSGAKKTHSIDVSMKTCWVPPRFSFSTKTIRKSGLPESELQLAESSENNV